MKHRSLSGFTVVELIIVVAVIAILATIAVVSYNGIQASARDKSVLSDVNSIESELARYASKHAGVYSTSLNWYSSGAANTNIQFTPSEGNIIDVVASDTEYCIRAYNPKSNKASLATAHKKGSGSTACSTLAASSAAIADSPLPTTYATNFDNNSLGIWSRGHLDATLATSTERARSGTRSAKQSHTDTWTITNGLGSGDPGDGLRGTVTGLTVGKTYRWSGWVYALPSASESKVFWQPVTPSGTYLQGPNIPFNVWTEFTLTLTATSTTQYMYIYSVNANTATSNGVTRTIYVDDISVTEI